MTPLKIALSGHSEDERSTTDARLRLGSASRRRRLLPPAVSSRRSPPPSLTLASAERWQLIHARRSAPLLVALLVGGVTVGLLRQHSGALLIEPPLVSADGRAPWAPAPFLPWPPSGRPAMPLVC